MSSEGNFEKTRIQDPEKAQEEANMVTAQAEASHTYDMDGEGPTAADYDEALAALEKLEEDALSPLAENASKPMRSVLAGIATLGENAQGLIGWSLASVLAVYEPETSKIDVKGRYAAFPREKLSELVKDLGEGKLVRDYKENRNLLASARELLEKRRLEAEEIAKR